MKLSLSPCVTAEEELHIFFTIKKTVCFGVVRFPIVGHGAGELIPQTNLPGLRISGRYGAGIANSAPTALKEGVQIRADPGPFIIPPLLFSLPVSNAADGSSDDRLALHFIFFADRSAK